MHKSFLKVRNILEEAWPDISDIFWEEYGEKLEMYNGRIPKYTGLMLHYHTIAVPVGGNTTHYGLLTNPAKTLDVVTSKIELLLEGAHSKMASMSFRNPDKGHWGGAIRSHANSDNIYAISGLPEIGDHLVLAFALYKAGELSTQEVRDLTKSMSRCRMTEAREFVGMSEDQFHALKQHIEKIV